MINDKIIECNIDTLKGLSRWEKNKRIKEDKIRVRKETVDNLKRISKIKSNFKMSKSLRKYPINSKSSYFLYSKNFYIEYKLYLYFSVRISRHGKVYIHYYLKNV